MNGISQYRVWAVRRKPDLSRVLHAIENAHCTLPFRPVQQLFDMPSTPPYAIVLDDHPLVGRGMAQYLQAIRPELPVRVATAWAEVQRWVEASGCPKVLVADVWLADSNSLAGLAHWRSQCRHTPWLAISGDDDPLMLQQVRSAGAQGFVHKQAPPEVFGRAFAAVLAGREWYEPGTLANGQSPRERTVSPADLGLTPRQGDVLALVLRGLPNKRIAVMLELSESTVKEHVTGILQRLGVNSRVHAITLLQGRRLTVDGTRLDHTMAAP